MGLFWRRWVRPLAGAGLVVLALGAPAVAHRLQVQVQGREVTEARPWIADGQLLGWVRPLASALGGRVEWDGAQRRVDVWVAGRRLSYWVGSRQATLDGMPLAVPAAPRLVDGRAYVPVWFTAGVLGWQVDWDGAVMRIRPGAPARPGAGGAPAGAAAGGAAGGAGAGPLGGRAAGQGAGVAPAARDGDLDPRLLEGFVFPFPPGTRYEPLVDNFGDVRTWSPDGPTVRRHEGIDILAAKGTPVVAAGSGRIVKMGWGQYGGWRLNIALDGAPGYILYYAHLDRYAPGLAPGARVRAGQVVGYVGNTGYGPEGTEGKFPPHLHLGLYDPSGRAVNPFPYLQRWEKVRS